MTDINNLLSKHFCGETTAEEEIKVQQYKLDFPEEYVTLKLLWQPAEINHIEVNAEDAWNKITATPKTAKRIQLYPLLRIATSAAAAILLFVGAYFLYNQVTTDSTLEIISFETTSGEKGKEIELEDGSIIVLNKNTKLNYPIKFSKNKREVVLSGEAFFDIVKDSARPFIIKTPDSKVEVLGTSFNINTKDNQTEVSVATGKVKVVSNLTKDYALLMPAQTAIVNAGKLKVKSINDKNYMAWKTGEFSFDRTPITSVVKELSTFYNQQLSLSNSNSDCLLTSTFENLELNEIVEIIQLSCGLKLNTK